MNEKRTEVDNREVTNQMTMLAGVPVQFVVAVCHRQHMSCLAFWGPMESSNIAVAAQIQPPQSI